MHNAKVRSCLGVRFSNDKIEHVLEFVGALDRLAADDVQDLMALLRE
jgi:hypothetical protein